MSHTHEQHDHSHGGGCCAEHSSSCECSVHAHAQDEHHEASCSCEEGGGEELPRKRLLRLAIGGLLLAGGLLVSHFAPDRIGWMATLILAAGWLTAGYDVLLEAVKGLRRRDFFNENTLMAIASLGAFLVGEAAEGVAVMLFYQLGELFQGYAVGRSRRSIRSLVSLRPDTVTRRGAQGEEVIAPEEAAAGDMIIVRPGERIALDGVVREGMSALDTSALTGESLPQEVSPGSAVLSGSVNAGGVLAVEVTKPFAQSTATRILELVENASAHKAPTETFIRRFSRVYTPAVVGAAALLAVLPPLLGAGEWSVWFHRALLFLVVSCPCALVISVPLGYFGGIGGAARRGVLVKGGNYLEALSRVTTLAIDKTGTLTEGRFTVTELHPSGCNEEALLEYAAYAEQYSHHPIARSIVAAYGTAPDETRLSEYHEQPARGVFTRLDGRPLVAGRVEWLAEYGVTVSERPEPGLHTHVAYDGVYLGAITLADRIKPDSAAAMEKLKRLGVRRIVMLTGDSQASARPVADAVGITEVHAGLLPAQKLEILQHLQAESEGRLCCVGDGINDAPALRASDVGIAMGAMGSEAAIEAADIVLMTDEPSKLPVALAIARKTQRIVRQNVAFSLGVKAVVMVLGIAGLASMWAAVFADVGVALLAVANSMRVLRQGKIPFELSIVADPFYSTTNMAVLRQSIREASEGKFVVKSLDELRDLEE